MSDNESNPSRVPTLAKKLTGKDNYRKWRFEAEVALKYYRALDIVKGTATVPTHPGAPPTTGDHSAYSALLKTYKKAARKLEDKSDWATFFLLSNIDEEVKDVIPQDGNPAILWKALEEQFDLQTVSTLFSTFSNLISLQYSPETPLKEHLTTFANVWRTVVQRCSTATSGDTDDFAYHLKNMTSSNMSKKNFLLQTLKHESLNTIVENILSKDSITYSEIHDKLMDIGQAREQNIPGPGSFNVRYGQKPPAGGKPPTREPRDPSKECSFCKKNGDYYKGHLTKECNKKKKAKKEAKKESANQSSANTSEITVACWMATSNHGYASFVDQCFVDVEYPDINTNYDNEWANMEWEDEAPPVLQSICDWDITNNALVTGTGSSKQWIFDTGATDHMSGSVFDSFLPQQGTVNAAGHQVKINGKSTANIAGSIMPIALNNVLHVPEFQNTNLISWRRLDDQGFTMEGSGKEIRIMHQGKIQGKAVLDPNSRLYILQLATTESTFVLSKATIWHQRLGHLPSDGLRKLKKMIQDPHVLPDKFEGCTPCHLGKATKLPRPISTNRAERILSLIHSDLSGKQPVQAPGGYSYFMSFIDDYSRFTTVVLLKNKSDASEAIQNYITAVETQTGLQVQRFRSDNGGEYVNSSLQKAFLRKGIKHETSVPYSHESNGVAERFNRSIQDLARTSGINSKLPPSLWGEAIAMMTHIKNRLPHSALTKQTPYQAYYGVRPTISHLRYFGETAYVFCPPETRKSGSKLSPRAEEGRVCGFGEHKDEYRVYLPNRRQVVRSRDVRFEKPTTKQVTHLPAPISSSSSSSSPSSSSASSSSSSDEEQEEQEEETIKEEFRPVTPPPVPSKSDTEEEELYLPPPAPSPTPKPPTFSPTFRESHAPSSDTETQESEEYQSPDEDHEMSDVLAGPSTPPQWPLGSEPPTAPSKEGKWSKPEGADDRFVRHKGQRKTKKPERLIEEALMVTTCPLTFNQAIEGTDKDKWVDAMQEEYDALILNEVWDIVPRPNKKVVKSRWVFTQKLGPSGEIARYKARFVAKGFSQIYGIDYEETFSPVFRYESLRMLFAIMASHPAKWDTRQSDVKNAFLNGKLREEVYVEQPLGYKEGGDKVLRLKKTLYGLKQSPREWHAVLFRELEILGLRRSSFDPSVFINTENTLIIAAFVDDLGTFFCDPLEDKRVAEHLARKFRMTDGGKISWIVGIKVTFSDQAITLSQSAYVQQILERFDMMDCRTVKTPFENHSLVKAEPGTASPEEIAHYQAVVGSLMYAALGTRPDIAFATTFLSQFSSNPGPDHTAALQRVLRYLRGTITLALVYPYRATKKMTLQGFADASHGSDLELRRSFSGNCFLLNQCLITWKTEKQKSVAISSTEAEYMAISEASRQLVWLRRSLNELSLWPSEERVYELLGDNTGALALIRNPVFHRRSKHIEIHYHYVRERHAAGDFVLSYVPTADNVADIFTKGLGRVKHVSFLSQLNCLEQGRVLE